MDRETITSKLFKLLSDLPSIRRSSRILVLPSNIGPPDRPFLILVQSKQTSSTKGTMPPTWVFEYEAYVYVSNGDPLLGPSHEINRVLHEIEEAFSPLPPTPNQTLGLSNVHHCRIDGDVETDEGGEGPDGIAVIRIQVLVAPA